jgi:monofunctional biosynthetic peptidoglycan transglycosylase
MIKFGAIALPALLLFVAGLSLVYPDVSKLKKENPRKTAFMEYREKEWRQQGKKRRIVHTWVPFSAISPYAVKAVIIAEDDKFWSHEGFDYEAMQKALEKDLKKKKFKAGGSTISQQLAKNLYLSPSKNPIRKLREAVLTWRIENALTKRRILELYLNVVEWGDGVFGVEAAARHHFGKSAADLSPREAARLATVLPNPRRYRPTGTSRYVENQSERIYSIMVQRGIVIPEFEDAMTPDESSPEADQKKNSLVGP